MEASSSLCNSSLAWRPFFGDLTGRKKVSGGARTVNIKVLASKRDAHSHNFDGKLVDESMVVLRRRIHEMTMLEKSYEPPRHWMKWEKQYKKANYDLDVCEAAGYLQSKLMETRPGVALGVGALLLLTLPTSMAAVLFRIMATVNGL